MGVSRQVKETVAEAFITLKVQELRHPRYAADA